MNSERKDIPELKLDRSVLRVTNVGDDSDEIAYWNNTTVKERLQHMERLRRMNYGVRATERLQRVIRVVKYE
jgi:hypothetical protein